MYAIAEDALTFVRYSFEPITIKARYYPRSLMSANISLSIYSLLSLPMLLSFSAASGERVRVCVPLTLPDALRPAPSRLPPCVILLLIAQRFTPVVDVALDGNCYHGEVADEACLLVEVLLIALVECDVVSAELGESLEAI